MAKQFQAVRGMNDILPGESALWQSLETTVREVLALDALGQDVDEPFLEEVGLKLLGSEQDIDRGGVQD